MGPEHEVTENGIRIAKDGVLLHLQQHLNKEENESFAAAIERLNLWPFVDHMALVLGSERATVRNLYYNHIHPTMKGNDDEKSERSSNS